MRFVPTVMKNVAPLIFALAWLAASANAIGDWQVIEPAEVGIGAMAPLVVSEKGAVATTVVQIAVVAEGVRHQLIELANDGTVNRTALSGIDGKHFADAYLRKLISLDNSMLLVAATSAQIRVYEIDKSTAQLLAQIDNIESTLMQVVQLEDSIVLLGQNKTFVASIGRLDQWKSEPTQGVVVVDAGRGGSDCPVDVLARNAKSYGLYCLEPSAGQLSLIADLGSYGLIANGLPRLVGSTTQRAFILGASESGQVAMACGYRSRACEVTAMQVSMFPSAPHDPWTVMLPNSRFAVSSFPRGDRAEVAVANLITGEHRRLADLQIDVIVSGDANGWQAIGEFDILPTANGIQIIYMLYSETSTGGGYNANIMHGLRAREVVVSTDTVRELFSRSPLTGDRLRGPSTE